MALVFKTETPLQSFQVLTTNAGPVPVYADGDPDLAWGMSGAPGVAAARFCELWTRAVVVALETAVLFPVLQPFALNSLTYVASGSMTTDTFNFVLRKNTVNTLLTLSVPPGGPATTPIFSQLATPIVFNKGDVVSLQCTQSAAEVLAALNAHIIAG